MRMWQALTVLSAFVQPREAAGVVEQIWLLLKVCFSVQSWYELRVLCSVKVILAWWSRSGSCARYDCQNCWTGL